MHEIIKSLREASYKNDEWVEENEQAESGWHFQENGKFIRGSCHLDLFSANPSFNDEIIQKIKYPQNAHFSGSVDGFPIRDPIQIQNPSSS